ncbi:tail protein [Lentzea atacamensis]|uniref:Tail protein n=1 Tax=Lentzea atacamensis TaxID=531938 RepID=A0A316HKH1_9PSEU|nr:tail protein [Lentzea atacamensis]
MPESTQWVDADGATLDLDVDWDVQGRGMPPLMYETELVPEQPGERLRAVRHGAREFVLRLWITGASEAAMWTAVRDTISRMDPARGDGKIRVTTVVGDQREITCRVQSGLELSERLNDTSGPEVQRAAVVFRASDPYWYDLSDTVETWQLDPDSATWFPIFPLRLASSEVFTDATVTNTGDVEAWPVWTITGPGSSIILRNLTTGKLLSLGALALTSSQVVTIDTRPGKKTITLNDGTNLFSYRTADSSLWSLRRGANAVRIEMSSATAASSVQLARKHRYLGV